MRKTLVVVATACLALGLMGLPAAGITHGKPDAGRHPYVGLAVFDDADGPAWRCSGTLLSPTVFLTAGHCTDGAVAARVWMDEVVSGNPEYPRSGSTSYDGVPHTNPNYQVGNPYGGGNGLPAFSYRDTGVIVLTEAVPTSVVSEYGKLPTAGLVDTLRNRAPVDFVGYGVTTRNTGSGNQYPTPPPFYWWTGLRNRLYAPSELVSGRFVHSAEYMRLSLNSDRGSGGTCFGDSGGPDLKAGTNIVLAVNSYVTNYNCSGVGYSARVDIPAVLAWVQSFM